jgi:hypothetical protein
VCYNIWVVDLHICVVDLHTKENGIDAIYVLALLCSYSFMLMGIKLDRAVHFFLYISRAVHLSCQNL